MSEYVVWLAAMLAILLLPVAVAWFTTNKPVPHRPTKPALRRRPRPPLRISTVVKCIQPRTFVDLGAAANRTITVPGAHS